MASACGSPDRQHRSSVNETEHEIGTAATTVKAELVEEGPMMPPTSHGRNITGGSASASRFLVPIKQPLVIGAQRHMAHDAPRTT